MKRKVFYGLLTACLALLIVSAGCAQDTPPAPQPAALVSRCLGPVQHDATTAGKVASDRGELPPRFQAVGRGHAAEELDLRCHVERDAHDHVGQSLLPAGRESLMGDHPARNPAAAIGGLPATVLLSPW